MIFSGKKKCDEAKQLEYKRNTATTPAQRKHFQGMIDSHKKTCPECSGKK